MNATGSIKWINKYGGTSYDLGTTITSDANGVYVGGSFYSPTLTFGSTTVSRVGNADIFLVKLTPSGSVTYAKSYGNTGWDWLHLIAVDPSTSAIGAVGRFASSSLTFGSIRPLTNAASGTNDIFAVKLQSNGEPEWAYRYDP